MKKLIVLLLACAMCTACFAQSAKKESRKNLVVKEWNRGDGGKGARFLDHVTKYNADGRKIEDIEYSSTGAMKARCTYEYDADGKLVRQVIYNDSNKPSRIRKFEYNADGTKKKQYTYNPSGKLQSVKEFEYVR